MQYHAFRSEKFVTTQNGWKKWIVIFTKTPHSFQEWIHRFVKVNTVLSVIKITTWDLLYSSYIRWCGSPLSLLSFGNSWTDLSRDNTYLRVTAETISAGWISFFLFISVHFAYFLSDILASLIFFIFSCCINSTANLLTKLSQHFIFNPKLWTLNIYFVRFGIVYWSICLFLCNILSLNLIHCYFPFLSLLSPFPIFSSWTH